VQTRLAVKIHENLDSSGEKGKRPAMAPHDKLKPNGKTGKLQTILSIDGGGVRGIIPAKILEVLERHLEELENEENAGEHDLWEYFDMIAGTSSGGLITAMITTPSGNGSRKPCCNASEVVEFFKKDAVKIFPKTITNRCCLRWLLEGIASVFGSIYEATPLEKLLRDKFGEALLSGALTSVIIPAFDTHDQVPVFFSNLKGVDEANPLYNVYVKDACRATTAVPILFPPAVVEEQVSADQKQPGRSKVFNVIDGGIAVNDPTLVAVTQAIAKKQQALAEEQSRDCMVRISTFVEQRPPLGVLGLECLQMGSMTIAHLH
jgi:patatin-like phospholipase/acyl hydrolase